MPRRTCVRSSKIDEGVDIAITHGKYHIQAEYPITVGQQFQATSIKYRERKAIVYKKGDSWYDLNYSEYYIKCIRVAKSFIKLGLARYGCVGILGMNSPEWFFSNFGAIFAGGVSVAIDIASTSEECRNILADCKAEMIVVGYNGQLRKVLEIRDQLPHLKAVILYKGKLEEKYENLYTWEDFLGIGQYESDRKIEQMMISLKPTHCCSVLYTPGTTGKPKGAMLSHDNVTWTAKALYRHISPSIGLPEGAPTEILSHAPLNLISAQLVEMYFTLYAASTVYFAQADIVRGKLQERLTDIQPFMFAGIPQTWENIMANTDVFALKGVKKILEGWARSKAYQASTNIQRRRELPFGISLANKVLRKVKEKLGFANALLLFGCNDVIPPETVKFFMHYDLPLLETYGLAESSGICNLSTAEDWRIGSTGRVMTGTRLRIFEPDCFGEGEIQVYGRHVFMGYLNDPQKSLDAIDDDGWLHTGDIGRIDIDGFLTVRDRLSSVIVTSGGERILPRPIENRIKSEISFLGHVVVVGHQRNYITALLTLRCKMEKGLPTDTIHPMIEDDLEALGCTLTSITEIVEQAIPEILTKIQDGVNAANSRALTKLQQVERYMLLPHDFSVAGGELGSSQKLLRHAVHDKYSSIIDNMYDFENE